MLIQYEIHKMYKKHITGKRLNADVDECLPVKVTWLHNFRAVATTLLYILHEM